MYMRLYQRIGSPGIMVGTIHVGYSIKRCIKEVYAESENRSTATPRILWPISEKIDIF
jgi:hypothetical protein